MTPSEFAAMIDLAQDHGEAVPTLDDYTKALETLRERERLATVNGDWWQRHGYGAMNAAQQQHAQALAMQNMSEQEAAMRRQLQAAGLQHRR